MPLSQKKVVSIFIQQAKEISERCEGYHEEIIELTSDILVLESQHKIAPRNIQVLINEKCSESGNFLAEKRRREGKGS